MSHLALQPPGVRVESVRPEPEPSPLRSDIAGFVGPTRRGPIGRPLRVEGWRGYRRVFGGLDAGHDTTYAVRGYFENGGDVAWVVRLAPDGLPTASATWQTGGALWGMPASIRFSASSPGAWADGMEVAITFRREGRRQRPEIDLFVRDPGPSEPGEALLGLDAWTLLEELAARSIRLRCDPFAEPSPAPSPTGPRVVTAAVALALAPAGGLTGIGVQHYLAGLDRLADQPEVAILVAPQLLELADPGAVAEVVHGALRQAEELRDRIVLVDVPRPATARPGSVSLPDSLSRWLEEDLERSPDGDEIPWRAGACYFPWIRVDDPLDPVRPLRSIPPSGHVAGVISLLDRERGAHHTPALEPMIGVFDLEEEPSRDDRAALNQQGINLLRCVPGRGFAIFGGRTLDLRSDRRYLAHRRLIHRLVRAIRRVAEPLVFETNGPTLWLQLVRAITSVLLEAWRSGALQGARADEAFRVQCDGETNPPAEIDAGRCLCRVELAPAVPMEFILLRLALGRDGTLEVLP